MVIKFLCKEDLIAVLIEECLDCFFFLVFLGKRMGKIINARERKSDDPPPDSSLEDEDAIKDNRKLSRTLPDNAPDHSLLISKVAIKNCRFQEISHPPYSPDMNPRNFTFFQSYNLTFIGDDLPLTKRSR